MRRNIFLTLCCFACIGFTSCSDEYTDATSKHVYGENENPYMRVDIDAQMSVTAPLEVNGEHAYTINLTDYPMVENSLQRRNRLVFQFCQPAL